MIHYGDMTEAQHAYAEGRVFGARDEREKMPTGPWTEGDTPGEDGLYLFLSTLGEIKSLGVSGFSKAGGWFCAKHGLVFLRYARINTSNARKGEGEE
jgi:hypothetical protein